MNDLREIFRIAATALDDWEVLERHADGLVSREEMRAVIRRAVFPHAVLEAKPRGRVEPYHVEHCPQLLPGPKDPLDVSHRLAPTLSREQHASYLALLEAAVTHKVAAPSLRDLGTTTVETVVTEAVCPYCRRAQRTRYVRITWRLELVVVTVERALVPLADHEVHNVR